MECYPCLGLVMFRYAVIAALLLSVVAACRDRSSSTSDDFPEVPPMADTGITQLQMTDTKVGTGAEARPGRVVRVHYTGWLYDASKPDKRGEKFDSSKDGNTPIEFTLGGQEVIPGWDEGMAGMKVGGTRKLTIPPAMEYGASRVGG